MRRILLVMVLLLLSSCHLKQDEAFVNPVFYGKMESQTDLWDVTITPTTFDMDNRTVPLGMKTARCGRMSQMKWCCAAHTSWTKNSWKCKLCETEKILKQKNTILMLWKSARQRSKYIKVEPRIIIYSYYEDRTNPEFASKRGYLIRTPEAGVRIKR